MKQIVRAVCAALLLWQPSMASAHTAEAEAARQFVDTVASQVLDVLKADQPAAEKQQRLASIFTGRVDTNFIGRFVLGPSWRGATPQQQQAYISAYGPFIIRNYAAKLTHYSGQQYTLKNARQDEDGSYLVTMAISGGNSGDALVDYRLRPGGAGGFQLTDIVVEGVSLLATQRSEFNAIVQSKGLDYLIAQLKAKSGASA
jgi:phospholipid transport system substrate-binding protein